MYLYNLFKLLLPRSVKIATNHTITIIRHSYFIDL